MNLKINQWGSDCLTSLGYQLNDNAPEIIQNTPWSYVVRFNTTAGYIYLKHMPEQIALEADIIKILQDKFKARVPKIIANNPELHCFLMVDAGKSLREILWQQFNPELLCQAIDQFTLLQLAITEHIDIFLNIGVPDYRLDKLSGLYMELIAQQDLLQAEGLSDTEIIKLEQLLPTITDLSKKLSSYPVTATIVQPDFHDNNILIDNNMTPPKITLIDLGEIVISYPLFSELNCLWQLKKHHQLTEQDDKYLIIKEACFKNYRQFFASQQQLAEAVKIAESLRIVYELAYTYRFMLICGKENLVASNHWKLKSLIDRILANITRI
jgi:hypothetical protein